MPLHGRELHGAPHSSPLRRPETQMPSRPSMLRPPTREQDAPASGPAFSTSGIRSVRAVALANAPPSPEVARFRPESAALPEAPLAEFDDDVDTGIVLTPALLAAIRSVAPARRRSKLGYVIAVALLVAAFAAVFDPRLREFIATRGQLAPSAAPQPGAVHRGL